MDKEPKKARSTSLTSHSKDVVLCEFVSSYACLYDLKHPKYKDVVVRDNAWEEKGTKMKLPMDLCKKRWRTIRDTYKRNKKERKVGTGSKASAKPKKWVLSDYLGFLETAEYERGSTTNVEQEMPEMSDTIVDECDNYDDEILIEREEEPYEELNKEEDDTDNTIVFQGENNKNEDSVDSVRATSTPKTTIGHAASGLSTPPGYQHQEKKVFLSPQKRKRLGLAHKTEQKSKNKKASVDNQVVQLLEKRQIQRDEAIAAWKAKCEKGRAVEDETDVFFKSMAMTVKKFHPSLKAEVKRKVFNLVMDIEVKNDDLSLGPYSISSASHSFSSSYRSPSPNYSMVNNTNFEQIIMQPNALTAEEEVNSRSILNSLFNSQI